MNKNAIIVHRLENSMNSTTSIHIQSMVYNIQNDDSLKFDSSTADRYGSEGHLVHPLIEAGEHWVESYSDHYGYDKYFRIHREKSNAINLQKFSSIFNQFENFKSVDTKYIKNILLDMIHVLHPSLVKETKSRLDKFNVQNLCYNCIGLEKYDAPFYSDFFILDEFEYVRLKDSETSFLTRSIRMKFKTFREMFGSSNRLISVSFFVEAGILKMRYFFFDRGNTSLDKIENVMDIDTNKPIRYYTFEVLKNIFSVELTKQGYENFTYEMLDDLFAIEDMLSYN